MGPNQRKYWYEALRIWFRGNQVYFMLLCHDRRDFTLFRVTESPAEAATALFEYIDNRGQLVSIDKVPNDNAYEIWIIVPEERDYCYFLFPYDAAIIEC